MIGKSGSWYTVVWDDKDRDDLTAEEVKPMLSKARPRKAPQTALPPATEVMKEQAEPGATRSVVTKPMPTQTASPKPQQQRQQKRRRQQQQQQQQQQQPPPQQQLLPPPFTPINLHETMQPPLPTWAAVQHQWQQEQMLLQVHVETQMMMARIQMMEQTNAMLMAAPGIPGTSSI